MSEIKFIDNSAVCKAKLSQMMVAFLTEVGGEIASQVTRNTKRATGKTAGSWSYIVDKSKMTVTIGSTEQNAIYEEFGTGLYAVKGNGRKTPWRYKDSKGNWHTTHGKSARKPFENAKNTISPKLQQIANTKFTESGNK